jgi:hypothetical protein
VDDPRMALIELMFGELVMAKVTPRFNRVRLYVDVEIPVQCDEREMIDQIKERIIEQVAGHRTPRRLAETCTVSEWEE